MFLYQIISDCLFDPNPEDIFRKINQSEIQTYTEEHPQLQKITMP